MPRGPNQLTETREGELLRLLARVSPEPAALERARELLPGIDWEAFRLLMLRHGVLPLAYRSLAGELSPAVPVELLAHFRQDFHRNARANLGRIRELKRLLQVLAAADVPILALKGPAVAEMAYGDAGLRCYGDLDLLTPPAALARAVELARENGYAPLWALTPAQARSMQRHGYHYNLRSDDGRSHLEIHWRIIDPCFAFALPEEELWERKVPVMLGSDAVETLGPEDQLLFLCVHGAKHFWSSLKLVCDVAELVNRRTDLDWRALARAASHHGGERMLHLGLRLADDLVGAPLPEAVRASIRADRTVDRLEAEAREFLSMETPEQLSVSRMTAFHLRLFPTLAARARYLRASSAPKELDVLTFQLPEALSPLYLLLRPLRLLFRLKPRSVE
jgi:hypothetical protein